MNSHLFNLVRQWLTAVETNSDNRFHLRVACAAEIQARFKYSRHFAYQVQTYLAFNLRADDGKLNTQLMNLIAQWYAARDEAEKDRLASLGMQAVPESRIRMSAAEAWDSLIKAFSP